MPKSHPDTPPKQTAEFEPEFVRGLKKIFEESIAFNQVLGLKIARIAAERVVAHIDMKPELVGHYSFNRIHGGVISAGLDAMGGLAVMAAIGARHMDELPLQRLHRFSKLGTIDLRIECGVDPYGISGCRWQTAVHRRRGLHRLLTSTSPTDEGGLLYWVMVVILNACATPKSTKSRPAKSWWLPVAATQNSTDLSKRACRIWRHPPA